VEDSYEITGIRGRVPEWLRGAYYVNGPARFERKGRRYQHWLDGDGMVCALHFSDAGVRFISRFIHTRKLMEENSAGEFLYRGFGTRFPGDRLRHGLMLEPPVNVSVYRWANRLLAFGEQTLPYELDADSLETRGEFDFGGRLNEVTPFAAHPKVDPATGHLFNFGISYSATQPALNLYEFDAEANMLHRSRFPMTLPHSNHDFGLSARHAVFFLSPLLMDFSRFWGDKLSVMESLRWEPERSSQMLIVPRVPKSEPALTIPVGSGYCLHLVNCFEQDNTLTADILELEEPVYREYQPIPDLFSTVSPGRPVRYRVSLDRPQILERIVMDYDRTPDFPSINPDLVSQPCNDFWMLGISSSGQMGRKFFDQLARGHWPSLSVPDVFKAPSGEYLAGEPVFVPRPGRTRGGPDEGVIIVQQLDARKDRVAFCLFDARNLQSGPIARLPLRHRLHPGFHASFFPESRRP
jgi:all-trans-8'-apo-beta-carotenal 15,15'-oxygenase